MDPSPVKKNNSEVCGESQLGKDLHTGLPIVWLVYWREQGIM